MEREISRRNVRIFYIHAILFGLVGIWAPTLVLFQLQTVGLSLTQVMIAEGLFAATIMLFEVPSGIWADQFSRRKVLIASDLLAFIGVGIFATSSSLAQVILSQFVMGIAIASRSGADQALLYDSLIQDERVEEYTSILSRLKSIEFGVAIPSTILGGIIAAQFGLRLPPTIAAIIFGICGILYFFLIDPEVHEKIIVKETFLQYGKKGWKLLTQSPFLMWLVVVFTIIGASGKLNFHTLNPYWELYEIPVFWFGIALACYNGLAMLTSLSAPRIIGQFGNGKALIMMFLIPVIGFGVMGVFYLGFWGALLFPIIFQINRSLLPIVTNNLLQERVESQTRATVISMKSFLSGFAQMIYLWLFGIISDTWGLFTGFGITAFIAFVLGGIAIQQLFKAFYKHEQKVATSVH